MKTAFAFDLDGTLTTVELLPLIAGELGLQSEMQVLTELTLNGTIRFEDSFRLRCAILRSIPISVVREVVAEAPLNETIAAFVRQHRERCFIVTGNLNVWVEPLLERLGCKAFTSTAQAEGDTLLRPETILQKSHAIQGLRGSFDRVVTIGESVNDVSMAEVADVSVAFGGVHLPATALLEVSHYAVFEGGALCRLLSTL
ncbi:MAG: HAD-IB family phosphatase [Myxococcaceae bacterium]